MSFSKFATIIITRFVNRKFCWDIPIIIKAREVHILK